MTADVEIPLLGGDVTEGLVRVGDTVRRPRQPFSDAVNAYLVHLGEVGFDGAPRYHGVDDKGRDILDFVPGDVPGQVPEAWSATDEVLVDVARLIRRLHDASESFVPPADAVWPGATPPPDMPPELVSLWDKPELVSHADVTQQNVVFRDGRPAVLIDFDMARPLIRLLDVLNTAMWWVPLRPPTDRPPALADVDVPARLRLFADAYGLDADRRAGLVPLAEKAWRRSWFSMKGNAEHLGGGWRRMWDDGVGDQILRRQRWLTDAGPSLTAALLD